MINYNESLREQVMKYPHIWIIRYCDEKWYLYRVNTDSLDWPDDDSFTYVLKTINNESKVTCNAINHEWTWAFDSAELTKGFAAPVDIETIIEGEIPMYNITEARSKFSVSRKSNPTWSEAYYADLHDVIDKGKCGIWSMCFDPSSTGQEAMEVMRKLTELGYTTSIQYDRKFQHYELVASGWAEE